MAERIEEGNYFLYRISGSPFEWNYHDQCLEVVFRDSAGKATEEILQAGDPVQYLGNGKCTKYDGTAPFCGIVNFSPWRKNFGNGSMVNVQKDQRVFLATKDNFILEGKKEFPKIYLTSKGEFSSVASGNLLIGYVCENSTLLAKSNKYLSLVNLLGA